MTHARDTFADNWKDTGMSGSGGTGRELESNKEWGGLGIELNRRAPFPSWLDWIVRGKDNVWLGFNKSRGVPLCVHIQHLLPMTASLQLA